MAESNRPPSTAVLSEFDLDFIAGSLLMPTECGRKSQNSNWKLDFFIARSAVPPTLKRRNGCSYGEMQSQKGSATVPVALFGVSPNNWCGRFHSPFCVPRRVLPTCRRDADGSGRDDRAPHYPLHR